LLPNSTATVNATPQVDAQKQPIAYALISESKLHTSGQALSVADTPPCHDLKSKGRPGAPLAPISTKDHRRRPKVRRAARWRQKRPGMIYKGINWVISSHSIKLFPACSRLVPGMSPVCPRCLFSWNPHQCCFCLFCPRCTRQILGNSAEGSFTGPCGGHKKAALLGAGGRLEG